MTVLPVIESFLKINLNTHIVSVHEKRGLISVPHAIFFFNQSLKRHMIEVHEGKIRELE